MQIEFFSVLTGMDLENGKRMEDCTMTQTVQLPAPNIHFLSDNEVEEIEARLSFCIEKQDFTEILKIAKVYPLPADQLEDIKRHFGMQFLLRNELNLANAIRKYGESWIEN